MGNPLSVRRHMSVLGSITKTEIRFRLIHRTQRTPKSQPIIDTLRKSANSIAAYAMWYPRVADKQASYMVWNNEIRMQTSRRALMAAEVYANYYGLDDGRKPS